MSRGSRFRNISSSLLMNILLVYLLTDTREHLSFLYCPRGPHWKTDVLGYKGVFPCNTCQLLSPFPFIILPYCLLPFHYSALLSASLSLFCLTVCFPFIILPYCLFPVHSPSLLSPPSRPHSFMLLSLYHSAVVPYCLQCKSPFYVVKLLYCLVSVCFASPFQLRHNTCNLSPAPAGLLVLLAVPVSYNQPPMDSVDQQ